MGRVRTPVRVLSRIRGKAGIRGSESTGWPPNVACGIHVPPHRAAGDSSYVPVGCSAWIRTKNRLLQGQGSYRYSTEQFEFSAVPSRLSRLDRSFNLQDT